MAKGARALNWPRRPQPARPYRKYPIRAVLFECNRRLKDARGPRAFELIAALISRSPQVQSGVVYIGDDGMGKLMGGCRCKKWRACACGFGRCWRTAHRAKYDLPRVGLVK